MFFTWDVSLTRGSEFCEFYLIGDIRSEAMNRKIGHFPAFHGFPTDSQEVIGGLFGGAAAGLATVYFTKFRLEKSCWHHGRSQIIFFGKTENFLLKENIFEGKGWTIQSLNNFYNMFALFVLFIHF